MPGWRIGMLASNADFVQWILKVKSNIDSGMFRAMQLAAANAPEAGEEWYEGNNKNYRNRRQLAGEIMRELGCTYDENQVGMFLWGKIPDSCADVEKLTERVLHEAHVFITRDSSSAATEEIYPHLALLQGRQTGGSVETHQRE